MTSDERAVGTADGATTSSEDPTPTEPTGPPTEISQVVATDAVSEPLVAGGPTPPPAVRHRRGRRIRGAVETAGYILERNRTRLIVVFGILTALLVAFGAQAVLRGIVGTITFLPMLAFQMAFAVVYIVFYFGVIFWFLGRPRKYVVTPDDEQIGLGFDNYRGQPDLLEHAKSTVKILQGIKEFELRGGEMPKGMLLSGQPGTGKTFLAACIAAEARLPFIYIDSSSLFGMFIGMTQLRIIALFRNARGLGRKYAEKGKRGACIVFMDELDSIGQRRSGQSGAMGAGGMMGGMFGGAGMGINTLLNEMDSLGDLVEDRWTRKILRWLGFVRGPVPPKPLVFVIGATNRPEVLDPALTRPGRLDRILEVYPPDADGRRDIIGHYLNQKAHDPTIDIEMMVADSMGWTPIYIKTIINEALIIAHDDGRGYLTYKDWLAAADVRTMGLKQPIRSMSQEDKRAIAYHEAGHAVVARYLKPEDRILKASIIRAGDALGVVQRTQREERYQLHARQIEVDIMIALGSRAVEEEFLDTKMAGASSDLMNATNRAVTYCSMLGMGSSLLVFPSTAMGGVPGPIARMADSMLQDLMQETKRLVKEKDYAVHAVANALVERGELIGQELEDVFVAADAANPDKAGPFVRKVITLPKLFEDPALAAGAPWAAEAAGTAAAEVPAGAAMGGPGLPTPSWPVQGWSTDPMDLYPPR
jgi:cell division protease FtsH